MLRTYSKVKLFVFAVVFAALFLGGCKFGGYEFASVRDAWRNTVGAASWAHGADLGSGTLRTVEERTQENGALRAKFGGSVECWTASFEEPLSEGGKVCGQVILPMSWNGTLWLIANDGPDGELPARAVSYAQDGSAVVCGDGGMGQVRRRNGRIDAVAAGIRNPSLRTAFFQEALALVLKDGRILAERKYGRAPERVFCSGRESGGAQALFLVAKDPSAVNRLELVNPAVDFAACAAYDLNVARQTGIGLAYVRQLPPLQFSSIQRAARDIGMKSFELARTNELWSAAGKYDDSFTSNRDYVSVVRKAWRNLLAPTALTDGTNSVAIPPVRLDMDFEPRMRERSWRLAWLLNEADYDATVSDADFLVRLPEMSRYTPPADLAPFFAAGGQVELTLETENARVPASVSVPLVRKNPQVRSETRVKRE